MTTLVWVGIILLVWLAFNAYIVWHMNHRR
jgi:hypothetical protein